MPDVTKLGGFSAPDDDAYTRYTLYKTPPGFDAKAFVERQHPEYHCQHSYDCCGRYYPTRARFDHIEADQLLVVRQDFRCNI